MPSLQQLRANRENARKSTGPRTPEGKQRSKMNGCKHGLTATTIVMTNEDAADFDSLRETLVKEYEAVGELELQCVDRVARHYFRMLRSARVEPAMFESRMLEIFYEQIGGPQNIKPEMVTDPTFDIDRGIAACYTRFGKDVDLHRRYEVSIERQYYSALDQLERLQDKRTRREERQRREFLRYRETSDRKTAAATGAAASLATDLDLRRDAKPVNLNLADMKQTCAPPSSPVYNFGSELSTTSPLPSNKVAATNLEPADVVSSLVTQNSSAALKVTSTNFEKSSPQESRGKALAGNDAAQNATSDHVEAKASRDTAGPAGRAVANDAKLEQSKPVN